MRGILCSVSLAVTLLCVGCGGGDGGAASEGAGFAPASAAAYAEVDTDVDAEEWRQVRRLLERFPGSRTPLDELREELREKDLELEELDSALGERVHVVWLDLANGSRSAVGYAKPRDRRRFERLVECCHREIDGWTVFAETRALIDRFERARGGESLADDDRFKNALEELPEDAVARFFVNGERASAALDRLGGAQASPTRAYGRLAAAAAALEAEEDGVRLVGFARNEDVRIEAPELGQLLERVPAGTLAFANFHGYGGELDLTSRLRAAPGVGPMLGSVEAALGVRLEELTSLFNEEGILYLRAGGVIPEVTLVLETRDRQRALRTLDTIARRAQTLLGPDARPRPRSIGGVAAQELDLGRFSIFYAALDERVLVTTRTDGITAVRGGGRKLVDDDTYGDVLEAAGVEDKEDVVLYADLERALQLAEELGQLGGDPIPPELRANLEPLRGLVVSTTPSVEEGVVRLFLQLD